MKRFLWMLVATVIATTVSAQSLLAGDANQDGELTIADVTKTANMVVGREAQTTIDTYAVDNAMIAGSWQLGSQTVTFNADGTTDYTGASTFEFRPVQGSLMLYDGDGELLDALTVLKITKESLVLRLEGGTLLTSSKVLIVDGHEYVNLGLPSGTFWATCNVGASSPEDYGLYFAWGETTGYTSDTSDGHSFTWANYQWCNGSEKTLTKYCQDSSYGNNGFTDTLTELELSDDAAYVNWGPNWRMPSYDQLEELIKSSYTTKEWTTVNGVYGRKITSKMPGYTDKYIFLPAAGCRIAASLSSANSYGYYSSRSLYTSIPYNVYGMCFNSSGTYTNGNFRYRGQSVRAVLNQ